MAGWEKISEEKAREIWNANLIKFAEFSPFQTFEQGQIEKKLGWQPQYWVYFDQSGAAETMLLGLLRRYPLGFGLLRCVGGPAGDISNCNKTLYQKISEDAGLKHLYLRVRWDSKHTTKDTLFLKSNNWQRSLVSMTSGLTMELDISAEKSEVPAIFSGKWRRNLRLAKKNALSINLCSNPNIEEIGRVFAEMEARKNLPQLFSREKLENFFKFGGSNLVFLQSKDEEGNLLAFRAALVAGNRACDFFAATSEKGRDLRVSYLLFFEMINYLQQSEVQFYDLGGIDPWANPGVYTFKKETGAREVELLGEWDWASSEWLRLFGNLAISKRENIKRSRSLAVLRGIMNPFKKVSQFFVRRAEVSESLS